MKKLFALFAKLVLALLLITSAAMLWVWQQGGLEQLVRRELKAGLPEGLHFSSLTYIFPFSIRLEGVRFDQIAANSLELSLSPSMFFDNDIHLSKFSADDLQIDRFHINRLTGNLYHSPSTRTTLAHLLIDGKTRLNTSIRPRETGDLLFLEAEDQALGKLQVNAILQKEHYATLFQNPLKTPISLEASLVAEDKNVTFTFNTPGNGWFYIPSFALDWEAHQPLNLDLARQSIIEATRSERGAPFPEGKGDEEDRLGKVSQGLNSKVDALPSPDQQTTHIQGSGEYRSDGSFQIHAQKNPYDLVLEGAHSQNTLWITAATVRDAKEQLFNLTEALHARLLDNHTAELYYGPITARTSWQEDAAHLKATGEIHEILQHFLKDTLAVSGSVDVDLKIQDIVHEPALSGFVRLSNGFYENIDSGARFQNIHAELHGKGNKLILTELTGQDLHGGHLSASGSIDHTAHYEIVLELNKALLIDTEVMQAVGTGIAILEGDASQALLKGYLTADSILIALDAPDKSITDLLEVEFINTPEGFSPPAKPKQPEDLWPVHLDVTIDIPKTLFISNEALDSTWKGSLHLSGNDEAPLLNGEVHIEEGSYDFQGKAFTLTQGTIYFAGEFSKKTTLYIVAGREIGDRLAEVIVRGDARDPALSFRSNPPLPQREILALILFGHTSSSISPDEGGQLDQTLTKLKSGANSAPDVLSRLRNTFGIDRIDISRSETDDSEVSVQVGKYIWRNVYVCVNKSLGNEANRVAIEATLINNLKLQAEVGDDYQAELLLKWKKDY